MYEAAPSIYVGTQDESSIVPVVNVTAMKDWGDDIKDSVLMVEGWHAQMDYLRSRGRGVMVVCQQGKSRAPTVVGLYCDKRGIQYSLMDYEPSEKMQRVIAAFHRR
jgi:hypothetical protein